MNKSDKFRELRAKEKILQAQLDKCNTAQSRMLRKAFKRSGFKLGNFAELFLDQPIATVSEITDWSVKYFISPSYRVETCEISFEDLFDAEVKE